METLTLKLIFSTLLRESQFSCNMGRKNDLSEDETHEMVQYYCTISKGMITTDKG